MPFEDAFKNKPSLLLEDLTRRDILAYVTGHFHENADFIRLQDDEPIASAELLDSIVQKASGVFLWVHLVVDSLLEGLSNSDRLSDLKTRLDALSGHLETLFTQTLSRLQPEDLKLACKTFRLLRTYHDTSRRINNKIPDGYLYNQEPTLLGFYFADDSDTKSSLGCSLDVLGTDVARRRSETMRRRLNARCKGLIEVRWTGDKPEYDDRSVGYLHRIARDFVESEAYWLRVMESTGHDSFNPRNNGRTHICGFRRHSHSLTRTPISRCTVLRAPLID